MTLKIWAVVPIKDFSSAKKRLAGAIDDTARTELVRAMSQDVIDALKGLRGLAGILVVTNSQVVRAFAQQASVSCLDDPPGSDLSGALQAAADHLVSKLSADCIMIVPADIPLVSSPLLEIALSQHESLTLAPDDEGEGTNLLIATPPDLIQFCYDGHGFQLHLERGKALGLQPHVLTHPRIELDIDTPQDLARLKALGKDLSGKRSLIAVRNSLQ